MHWPLLRWFHFILFYFFFFESVGFDFGKEKLIKKTTWVFSLATRASIIIIFLVAKVDLISLSSYVSQFSSSFCFIIHLMT